MNAIGKPRLSKLLPVFFCFAIMGFIDIAGVSTGSVKEDFALNDKTANLIPSMAMIWFALLSIPTSVLMRRIGRKNTVLISLAVTTAALFIPAFGYSFPIILLSFALLGIGNTILQVSVNPLLKNIVSEERMTSSITFGQFVKAIVSLAGPLLIAFFTRQFGNWRLVFYAYAAASLIAFIWLLLTSIAREEEESTINNRQSIFSLLKDRYLFVCFCIIVLIVGFEICLMTAIPKYLKECCGMPLDKGGLGCSLYYAARTIASFVGAMILTRISPTKYLIVSLIIALLSSGFLIAMDNSLSIMIGVAVTGLAAANVFAVVLSLAMQHKPEYANEISGLMVMGIAGGALLPPLMGILADMSNQRISLFVPLAALALILFAVIKQLYKKT